MKYRDLAVDEAGQFWHLMNRLDYETKYMLYEPGERKSTLAELESVIRDSAEGKDFLLVAEAGAYDGLLANLPLERLFLLTAHLALALEGRRARSRLPVGLFLGDLGRLRSLTQALPDRLGGRSYRLPDDILQVAVVLPIDCLLNSIANLIADILRSSHGTSQRIETHVFPKLF